VQLFAGEEELYKEKHNAQEHSEQFLWFKDTLKSLLGNSKFHTSSSALQTREKALPSRKKKKSAIQHNN
jgi:hypothetical protein